MSEDLKMDDLRDLDEERKDHEFTIYVVVFRNGEVAQNAASDIDEVLSKYSTERRKEIVFISEASHIAAKLYLQKSGISDKLDNIGDKISKGTDKLAKASEGFANKMNKFTDKLKRKK